MDIEPSVLLPVRCPRCGAKSMYEFPVLVVVTALTRWNHMALYTQCHSQPWDASIADLQTIRDHLGMEWLSNQMLVRNAG